MSFLFSGRDSVDVPPIRVPVAGDRLRMAGERPSRIRESRPEEREENLMEETTEREGRGRRAGRRFRGRRRGGRRRGGTRGRRKFDFPMGGRRGVKKTRGERPEGLPPKGPSKGIKNVTMVDPETGYKYGGQVIDGVPQFTKPDFSDRKPLPGYPKKDTDRVTSGKGKGGGGRVKQVTMRDPETGYKYGGAVIDGVPQFTKPDFSDRKPLPGYPKKDTDKPRGPRPPKVTGKRTDPRPPKTTKPLTGGFMQGIADKIFEAAAQGATGSGTGFLPTGKRDGDPRPPRPEGGRVGTGGRRSDPRPDRDPNRGRGRGERGRRRVRDEAFERRERSGNTRSMTRRERRRRVRNTNTPMIK